MRMFKTAGDPIISIVCHRAIHSRRGMKKEEASNRWQLPFARADSAQYFALSMHIDISSTKHKWSSLECIKANMIICLPLGIYNRHERMSSDSSKKLSLSSRRTRILFPCLAEPYNQVIQPIISVSLKICVTSTYTILSFLSSIFSSKRDIFIFTRFY